jgi:hypothetical protein
LKFRRAALRCPLVSELFKVGKHAAMSDLTDGQITGFPSRPVRKNILIYRNGDRAYIGFVLSHSEGRCATSNDAEQGAMDVEGAGDERT